MTCTVELPERGLGRERTRDRGRAAEEVPGGVGDDLHRAAAVAAKQFGEAQQKFPISHAAASGGKAVGKVKANAAQQSRAQGKHITQGR